MTENNPKNDGVNENSKEKQQNKDEMLKKMNNVVNSEKINHFEMPEEVENLAKSVFKNENIKKIEGHFSLSAVLDKSIDIAKKIGNYPLKHPIKTVLIVSSAAAMLSGVVIPIESIANTASFLSGIVTGGGTWGSVLSSTKALSLMAAGMPGVTGGFAFFNTAVIVGVPILAAKIGGFIHSKLFNKGHELAKSEFTNMPNIPVQQARQEIQVKPITATSEQNIQQQELPQETQKEPVEMVIQQNSIYEQMSLLLNSLKEINQNQSLSELQKEEISNLIFPQLKQVLSQTNPEPEKFESLLKELNKELNDELKRIEKQTNLAHSSNGDNMVLSDIETKQSENNQSKLFQNSLAGLDLTSAGNRSGNEPTINNISAANAPTINNITPFQRPKG